MHIIIVWYVHVFFKRTCRFLSLRVVKMPMVQEGEIPFEMVWGDLLEAALHPRFRRSDSYQILPDTIETISNY